MMNKLKRFRKIVSLFLLSGLILSIVSFYNIRTALATDFGGSWAQAGAYMSKEFGWDTVARFVARGLLSTTINTMVRKIQSGGRTGRDPSFIQDWQKFLIQAEHRGEDKFRRILGNTPLCDYLKGDIRSIFKADTAELSDEQKTIIRSSNLDPFTRRGRCTMPAGWTIDNFRRDFSGNGGWDALLRLAQPQNNFYGTFLMSLEELAIQRALDTNADILESQAGRGFTGIRGGSTSRGGSCDDPPARGTCLNNSSKQCGSDIDCTVSSRTPTCEGTICSNDYNRSCEEDSDCPLELPSGSKCVGITPQNSQARCTFLGKTFTPASLLGDAASQTIDKNIGWLISSDEISEVIVAVVDAVMNRLNNFLQNPGKDKKVRQTESQLPNNPDYNANNPYAACLRSCDGLARGTEQDSEFVACLNRCNDTPLPGQPGGPGGGNCRDTGTGTANYSGDVRTALDKVASDNPNGLADQPNIKLNSLAFLAYVVQELQSSGFNSTLEVLNGNGNENQGDLIAIWRTADGVMERYDVITDGGNGEPIRASIGAVQFTGDIPLTCIENGPVTVQLQVSHQKLLSATVKITASLPGFVTVSNFNYINIYVNGVLQDSSGNPPRTCLYSPCDSVNGVDYEPGTYNYYATAINNGQNYQSQAGSFTIP